MIFQRECGRDPLAFLALSSLCLSLSACGAHAAVRGPDRLLPGRAQVARLPHNDGLQFCVRVTRPVLAPAGTTYLYVHSFSAYLTTVKRRSTTLTAIHGRYPGWDTPGTTVYQQAFSNTNTVWLEIDHEFGARKVDCIEVYGEGLKPSSYASFKDRILLGFTYRQGTHGYRSVKLLPLRWGPYLPEYSPHTRPKH